MPTTGHLPATGWGAWSSMASIMVFAFCFFSQSGKQQLRRSHRSSTRSGSSGDWRMRREVVCSSAGLLSPALRVADPYYITASRCATLSFRVSSPEIRTIPLVGLHKPKACFTLRLLSLESRPQWFLKTLIALDLAVLPTTKGCSIRHSHQFGVLPSFHPNDDSYRYLSIHNIVFKDQSIHVL